MRTGISRPVEINHNLKSSTLHQQENSNLLSVRKLAHGSKVGRPETRNRVPTLSSVPASTWDRRTTVIGTTEAALAIATRAAAIDNVL